MFLQLLFLVFLITSHKISHVSCLNDEGLALLSFRQSIDNSTALASFFNNWNSSQANPCSWNGISCYQEKITSLTMPNKGLSGVLNLDFRKLVSLERVNLRNNHFYGNLPAELFSSTGLTSLVLSGNSFSGPISDDIGNLKSLHTLDLSKNYFNSSVPPSLIQCKRLKNLVLSHNRFTGYLPDEFGTILALLQTLNLSFNNFRGVIPASLGNLSNLKGVLDLSHNQFNGSIPDSLGNLPERVYIDLSYNNLAGPIPQKDALIDAGPTAFVGNTLLCGPPLKTPCPLPYPSKPSEISGKKGKHGWTSCGVIAVVAGTVLGTFLVAFLFTFWYKKVYVHNRRKCAESSNCEDKSIIRKDMFCFRTDDLESLSENMEQYTFIRLDTGVIFDLEQLLKASAFLLGKSTSGIIYKVVLEKGPTVAVRRLEDGSSQRFKEFQNEVEAIGRVRHQNIVSLLAYCWCVSEKLLIYEFVPNGDLATAIHGRSGTMYFKPLPWAVRLRIMKGVAKGLTFLHELNVKRYVHGNLKPSNVLLGENMEPKISDFGLNRLGYATSEESIAVQSDHPATGTSQQSSPYSRSSPYSLTPRNSRTLGSYYEAPEASKSTAKPSQKWDVYSFGVILLEMISGKSPVMQICSSEMDLVKWVQHSIDVKPISDILDPFLARDLVWQNAMVAVIRIALACVNVSPDKRPSMKNISDALEKLSSST